MITRVRPVQPVLLFNSHALCLVETHNDFDVKEEIGRIGNGGVSRLPKNRNQPLEDLDGSTPRMGYDKREVRTYFMAPSGMLWDTITVCYTFFRFCPRLSSSQSRATDRLLAFGGKAKLKMGVGADKASRDKGYLHREGQVTGVFQLVTHWHAVGQKVSSFFPLMVSFSFSAKYKDGHVGSHMLQSTSTFAATSELIEDLQLLSYLANFYLEAIDPKVYRAHVELNNKILQKYAFARMLHNVDPLLQTGRSLIFNRMTPDHADMSDHPCGWSILFCLGTAKGGWLVIRRLGIRIYYDPGAVIIVRGRILHHHVEGFDEGQRVIVAHFTHETSFHEFDVELSVE
jgi:hypothetical protein